MSNERRTTDRRRRVLYTSHHADNTPPTAASRRAAERMREARRPTAAYGSRVNRRLRGRWFSLVPVRRRTLATITACLGLLVLLLCGAHYASVAWPSIAYQPEIARPLRLDRPDSFGRWVTCVMLAASAGTSLLIYQLRRYRNDDYQGQYRLWRIVLIVMAVASVNSLVSMIDWGGAILDASFGKRVALQGSDWIRIVVSFAGAILALRLIAEVRRSRWALVTMIAAWSLLAVPEAAKWNVIEVDSVGKWVLITAAPLLACTTLFVSLGGYLRMLYREVRQIDENDSLKERFQQFRVRVFQRSDEESEDEQEWEDKPRRGWWGRRSRTAEQEAEYDEEQEWEEEEEEWEEEEEEEVAEEETEPETEPEADVSDPPRRRRWFSRRKPKPPSDAEPEDEPADQNPPQPKRKKRRFSLRLDPRDAQAAADPEQDETSEPDSDSKPLRGWFKRNRTTAEANAEAHEADHSSSSTSSTTRSADHDEQEDPINPDEIDWSTLSKSERRRLRKRLKRQGRAA